MSNTLIFSAEQKAIVAELRERLSRSDELWINRLLTAGKLAQLSADLGLPLYGDETITALWQRGLLRADLIQSQKPIKQSGLRYIGRGERNLYLYLDARTVKRRPQGYGSSISKKSKPRKDVQIYFHPFRFFVAYHLVRSFELRTSFAQFLVDDRGVARTANGHRDNLKRWTATNNFCEAVERWNDIAEIAIALAPCSYVQIFQNLSWGVGDSAASLRRKIAAYREIVKPALLTLGLKFLERVREQLCIDAEVIDSNKVLHVLLRLCNRTERGRLKGHIGGAMQVLAMAETIRRAVEGAFEQKLREEDELGFGEWMEGARKRLYGSERIIDAPKPIARQFLQTMGLDFSVKIRCYLEGETECGAFESFTSGVDGIEYINLRGQFLEKGGNALAFADALKNDMRSHIFSLIVLDGDDAEIVRIVRKAAANGDMLGWFYVAQPDFEYGNFTTEELEEVALELAIKALNAPIIIPPTVKGSVAATNGKAFMKAFGQAYPQLPKIEKGRAWGEALMRQAIRTHSGQSERQIIKIAKQINWTTQLGYQDASTRYRVNPQSGQLEKNGSNGIG
ncbi:MAG: hypothetical protein AB7I36_07245 [Rhodospirillaceae bacterium]